jgi:hypothetical protein
MAVARKLAPRALGVVGVMFAALAATGCGRAQVPGDLVGGRAPDVMTFMTRGDRLGDGVVAAAGTAWDSELSAVFQSGGSAEWDLGAVRPVARAFLQGDNDDRYALLGSSDRKTWTVLWEAEPVKEPGLQARSTDGLAAQARFLRLEPRAGDGRYAVSELVVTAGRDGAWPPRLIERLGEPSDPAHPPLGRLVLLALAIAAAAFLIPWPTGAATRWWRDPVTWITAGLAAFMVVTAVGYAALHRHNLADDAYISLQYAKNWASGQGLVFNPGERVEGYTNFLWVALLAPLWPLSGHDPGLMTRASTWLALALAVAGLVLVGAVARRVFPRTPRPLSLLPVAFALLLVALDDAYLSYTVVFALENHLLVVCMLAGLALAVFRPRGWDWGLGVTFALVGMTRPDGLLWAATFFAAYALPVLLRRPAGPEAVSPRALLRTGVAFAALFGGYFLLRAWYFRELLPNTFHLKVGGTFAGLPRGFAYLRAYAAERAYLPVLSLLAVFFTRALWARWLLVHAVLHALYVAYVGGDFYAGHRFLMALTPNLALLAAVVLERAQRWAATSGRQRLVTAAALAACATLRWGTLRYGPYTTELHGWGVIVDNNVKYMQWVKEVARPAASMVVGDIGATGLFADVRVIDVFGVVDPQVARKHVPSFGTGKPGHEKMATREEQLASKPTYIKWGYVDDGIAPPGYYIFNDFPLHLRVEGLWVKDDLARGRTLPDNAWHMTAEELASWSRTGNAFATAPSLGPNLGQRYVNGQKGTLVNSFTARGGDDATGRLLSPPFPLVGDRMRLLVGGGRDPERLRVSLLVDDHRVFSETGGNWETLGRREWDIAPLRGKTARLEIVDDAKGAWGHILVDEVEQWVGEPNGTGKL